MHLEEDIPDECGDDGEDLGDVLPCPACGEPVYEDSDKCPSCGDWIMPLAARAATPVWIRVVGAIVVFALLFGVIRKLVQLLR